MRDLILDIETVAVQNKLKRSMIAQQGIEAAVKKAVGACKKPDAIKARRDEFYADPRLSVEAGREAIYKTAVSPLLGEVFSVGILDVWSGDPVSVHYRTDFGTVPQAGQTYDLVQHEGEKELLDVVGEYLTIPGASSRITGFSVQDFDLWFMWVRSCVHRVCSRKRMYHLVHTRNEGTVMDLRKAFYRNYKPQAGESLNRMCECLGIDGKDGVSGKDVPRFVEDGKIAEVLEYAARDVEITRDAAAALGVL